MYNYVYIYTYIGFPAYNGDVTPAAVEPVAQF